MKPIKSFAIGALSIAMALTLSPALFAQKNPEPSTNTATSPDTASYDNSNSNSSTGQSAKQSMHNAGEQIENGVSRAYHKTRTALKDTAITAKAKTALSEDKSTTGQASSIHVDTVHGVVTLSGQVDSLATARNAEKVVARLVGVKRVMSTMTTANGSAATSPESGMD